LKKKIYEEYEMKKTSKKIFGGILVVMLIVTIGAVVASAHPGFFSDLTDEQKADLKETRETLLEEGATCKEIREAIRGLLESYGIELPTREEMLDKQIERTEQRLQILNRMKELMEDPDLTQEQIMEIIQEEFDLEMPNAEGQCIKRGFGFRRGPGCGPRGLMSSE
jgi:hypothetical protein